ncbi:MAG: gliding motility-associated C-terminal domain-containing protein, partial [Bacteroidota bacterium]
MKYLKTYLVSVFSILVIAAEATHIRAGEVIAKKLTGLTYEFTFIGYRDVDGVPFGQGIFDFGNGDFYGDDPGEEIPWANIEDQGNGVEKWEFTLRYEYSGPSNYLVSYKEDFRNANIQNIAGSVSTSFYVETLIIIDPLFPNDTPIFDVPPIDQAVVGSVFEHDPGVFDREGDSLSFYFVTPKQDEGLNVNGYQSLIDPSFYDDFSRGNQARNAPPSLTIDPETGIITWDAPGGATIPDMENREFNVAFVVEEWRKLDNGEVVPLGFVTRDMQIVVWDFENEQPDLEVPEDTCVVAGEMVTGIATATDPDGHQVKIEAFGGPFQTSPPPIVNPNPAQFQTPPTLLNFEWDTNCGQVRAAPYNVQFKVTDSPVIPGVRNPPGLVNFETWSITVVGPAPTGLTADTRPGRRMQLNWDSYSCPNADSMQVWRRVDEFSIDSTCVTGIPENSGYELIQTLRIDSTSFLDTNNGIGLSPGSKYCYRLVATFPSPTGGESIVSAEACDSLLIDVPVITNVDVKSTSETDGEIEVKWTPPYQIDQTAFPPTYTYEVLRKEGQGFGGTFTSIRPPSTDTTFMDTGLNTKDIPYSYKIVLYDNTDQPIDSSQQASSVRVDPASLVGAIRLNWEANVPWSNSVQEFPYHYIWRDNVNAGDLSSIQLIDSVDVTMDGLTYLDDGRFNGIDLDEEIEYCYFVTTFGSYGNELLPEPLINNSQIVCAQPNDSIPPCAPINVSFGGDSQFNCESQYSCERQNLGLNQELQNVLSWQENTEQECDDDISFYRIYVSKSDDPESFIELGTTTTTEFRHEREIFDRNLPLQSLAFCYYVTTVDRSGNESQISDIICNDNCPQYLLPNIITPDDDGFNDTFTPLSEDGQCPRFVESVLFKVFNRAGTEVFDYDSNESSSSGEGSASFRNSILINWNGKTKSGQDLPAGVYFYSAEVQFLKLNPEDSNEV